jgi:hypothetical protein
MMFSFLVVLVKLGPTTYTSVFVQIIFVEAPFISLELYEREITGEILKMVTTVFLNYPVKFFELFVKVIWSNYLSMSSL